jgi:hypothetical protein
MSSNIPTNTESDKVLLVEEVIHMDPSLFILSMLFSKYENYIYDDEFGIMAQNVVLNVDVGKFKAGDKMYQANLLPLKDKSLVISFLVNKTDGEDKWIDHAYKVNMELKQVNVQLVGGQVEKEKEVLVNKPVHQ